MKYETRLEMLKLSDIVAAPYNPREDIERGSDEYKALRRSIELNGMVEPPVVNLHNMRCIGGNQRLVVLRDLGWKEVLCSVIDQPDESKEMKLCLALNRIEGRWDTDRLGDLLRDDEVLEFETGFDRDEVLVYRQLGGDGEGEDADDDPDWDQDEDPDGENADGEEEDEPAGSDDEPMLERSIPDYRSMRALTYKLGERFIQPETLIVDVGCSTGLAVEPFVAKYGQSNNFLLVDNAPAMVEACEKRFRADVNVTVRQGNIWEYLPFEQKSSLVLSVLSMQFMPTSYRPRMLKQIYDGLTDGGAFIFVEKILSENMDDLMVDLYYEMKRENGYTDKQIMSKRRSLENVLSPLKAEWSVDMMRTAGFRQVDMFWRCLNFCGWIAVK